MARTLGRLAGALTLLMLSAPAAGAFELGNSGLHVERTPQSLMVTGIDPHSPADGARLSVGAGRVVRLRYVNGKDALDLLAKDQLRIPFGMPSVRLTLGVRGPNDLEERLEGPHELDLIDSPETRIRRHMVSEQWEKGIALVRSGALTAADTEAFWSRLALSAHERARAGQWKDALAIVNLLGPQDPAYAALGRYGKEWRMAQAGVDRGDRQLLAREVLHAGPNPRLAAKKTTLARQDVKKATKKVAKKAPRKETKREAARPRRGTRG